jgi:hypothetical protein
VVSLLFFVSPLLALEIWQNAKRDLLAQLSAPMWLRGALQGLLLLALILFWERKSVPFIYFQF